MDVTWVTFERTDQSIAAMVDGRRVGQVVRYDRPCGWLGFLGGERLPGGPLPTADAAQAVVEAAWASEHVPSTQPRRPGGGRARER